MKRSTSTALTLVLVGGLTACSGGGDKRVAIKAPEVAVTGETIKAMERGSTGGTTKNVAITVFCCMTQTAKQEGLEVVEEAFAGKHLEYQITWDNAFYSQGTDYFPQLQAALTSGDQPEVIMGNPGLYSDLVTESYMTDLMDNAMIRGLSLPFGGLRGVSHDDKIYGFPIDSKTWDMFCNRKIFVDNGIEEPKTYMELLATCKELDAAGIDPWAHAFNDVVFGDIGMKNYTQTKTLEAGDKDLFEELMSDEKKLMGYLYFEEGLNLWARRFAWMRDDAMTNDQNVALEAFASDETAMIYFGTWEIGDLKFVMEGKDFEYDFFAEPIDDKGSAKLDVRADQSFMLNLQAENYDMTLEFVEYQVQNGGDFWSAISLMPLLNGSAASSTPEVVQTLAKLKASGDIPHYGDFTVPFNSQFTSVWRAYLTAFAESYSDSTRQGVRQCPDDIQAKFDQIIIEQ